MESIKLFVPLLQYSCCAFKYKSPCLVLKVLRVLYAQLLPEMNCWSNTVASAVTV